MEYRYIGFVDLGAARDNCDICGTVLRYQHIFKSEKNTLYVGCECASKIIQDEEILSKVSAHDKLMRQASNHEKTIRKHYDEYLAYRTKRNLEAEPYESYKKKWLDNESKRKEKK